MANSTYDPAMQTYKELQGMSDLHKAAAEAKIRGGRYGPGQLKEILEPLKSMPDSELEKIIEGSKKISIIK